MGEAKSTANRNDLRWRRTERHLMEALSGQLDAHPLDKVKVTELCRAAEVSKAAFYLHYRDIYDLADAFVDVRVEQVLDELGDLSLSVSDLQAFVERFIEVFASKEQERFMKLAEENRMAPQFLDRFLRQFGERLDEKLPPPDESVAKVAVSFVIGGLVTAMQAHRGMDSSSLARILTGLMSAVLKSAPKTL